MQEAVNNDTVSQTAAGSAGTVPSGSSRLVERHTRLQARAGRSGGRRSLRSYLEQNVWPMAPAGELGRVMSREEEDRIPGYGPEGL
jgi:hypothetical protein